MPIIIAISERKDLQDELGFVVHGLRDKPTIKLIQKPEGLKEFHPQNIKLCVFDYMADYDSVIKFLEYYNKKYQIAPFPIMLIQKSFDREAIMRAAHLGVKSYILFPYTFNQLKDKIISLLSVELLSLHSVTEILKKDSIVLREHYSVKDALKHLLSYHLTGSVVLNADNEIVGYLSEKDLLSCVALLLTDAERIDITSVMVKQVLSLPSSTNISQALNIILRHNLRQIPIVDSKNKYIGMITRFDLLQFIYNQGLRV